MWTGQTTRSPLTAIQTEYSYSHSYSDFVTSYSASGSQTGKSDGSGATSGKTDVLGTLRTTYGGTTNASGGATTSYTNNTTSGLGTSAGAHTTVELLTGVSTSTITNKPGTVSTALSTIYTYPASTVATSTESTTRTNETAASEYTTLYGSTTTTTTTDSIYTQTTSTAGLIMDTSRVGAYATITCSANFEVIDTAFWLNDDERGWGFTGGAGIRPLNSLCTEGAGSFTTSATTTSTVARTRPVVDWLADVSYRDMHSTNATVIASWTTTTEGPASNTVSTFLTRSHLPNSTSTAYRSGITTKQNTGGIWIGSFVTTDSFWARLTETYNLIFTLKNTYASFIPAFDNSGNVTGFTTRSGETSWTSATEATKGAAVAESGTISYVFTLGSNYTTFGEGISETVTTQLEWTGLDNKGLGGPPYDGIEAWQPAVPGGVRVYESFQQNSIYAQIGASGLGFTVPFRAFSIFQRNAVFSPMDTTYTTTNASAGNTRSYTVSVGTSATNDTASFIFVTRATVSTTETSTSASLYNTVELTRRYRTSIDSDAETYGIPSIVVGGRQCDTRLEIAAFQEGVVDYTIVDTTTNAGVLTTIASYTVSAASSNLTAFSKLSGWSSEWRGPGYTTTPKWKTVWP
jgi:hypothetical protein